MVPVALSIGVPPGYVVAFAAACYGYYILPTYPSDLAAIQFDRSGTTHIGKYLINHSFILAARGLVIADEQRRAEVREVPW
jgi:anaerobic C4-dicarboxylate transporter DcuB